MPSPSTPERGLVVAVAASATLVDGIRKSPCAEIRVTRLGVPGDFHHGETRWSQSRRRRVRNDRPISVVAVEAVRAASSACGIPPLAPGALGENLLVEGLGDLSDLRAGDRLRVGSDVVLLVTEPNAPCSKVQVHHAGLLSALLGRRGVVCSVAAEGVVRAGDRVERAARA